MSVNLYSGLTVAEILGEGVGTIILVNASGQTIDSIGSGYVTGTSNIAVPTSTTNFGIASWSGTVAAGLYSSNATITPAGALTVASLTTPVISDSSNLTIIASNQLTLQASGIMNINSPSNMIVLAGNVFDVIASGVVSITAGGTNQIIGSAVVLEATGTNAILESTHQNVILAAPNGFSYLNTQAAGAYVDSTGNLYAPTITGSLISVGGITLDGNYVSQNGGPLYVVSAGLLNLGSFGGIVMSAGGGYLTLNNMGGISAGDSINPTIGTTGASFGDGYINRVYSSGTVYQSPNGTQWLVSVTNSGTLSIVSGTY